MADFQTPDDEAVPSGDFTTPDSEAIGPQQTGLESFGRGALRNFPLAQQAAAAAAPINPWSDKKDYSGEMAHLTDAAEQGKAQNKGAYYSGAAAASILPALIAPVAEGLEAAPVLGNAALGAAQGISDANVIKHPGQAAGDAAIGGGIGGIMGALGQYFAGARGAPVGDATAAHAPAPAVKDAITMEPGNESPLPEFSPSAPEPVAAPRKVGAQIDGTNVPEGKKVAADFVPSADRIYASNLAQGMGGTPRQLMKVFGKHDPVQSMVKIGQWMETAGEGGKSINGLLDRPGELLGKIDSIHESSGKTIGGIIDSLGKEGDVDTQGLLSELQDFADRSGDPATEARIMKLIKTTETNLKKGVGDFDNLQQIKGMAGKQIAKDPEMSSVYGHLADKMESHVDSLGSSLKDPEMAAAYAKAKQDYTQTSRLLPMLRYAEAKDLVGGPAGHHTLRGLLGSIFNMGTAMTGLPPAEQLGKNIMLKAAPVARAVVNAGSGARQSAVNAAAPLVQSVVPSASSGIGKKSSQLVGANAAQKEISDYLSKKFGKK